MPYIRSHKSDAKAIDRDFLDAKVENLAESMMPRITNNLSLISVYKAVFRKIVRSLHSYMGGATVCNDHESELAHAIHSLGEMYDYEGAYLGEFNYAITRLIQRVPRMKAECGEWKDEFRYWIYAATVEALTFAAHENINSPNDWGISGVFEDIKDEYKRRVNTAYEAQQILKNGDCYHTPFYTRLVEVVDEAGRLIGHQEIMLRRSENSLPQDLLKFQIIAKCICR